MFKQRLDDYMDIEEKPAGLKRANPELEQVADDLDWIAKPDEPGWFMKNGFSLEAPYFTNSTEYNLYSPDFATQEEAEQLSEKIGIRYDDLIKDDDTSIEKRWYWVRHGVTIDHLKKIG